MNRKIVCAVVIAHCPDNSAGNTWAFLNWVLGLRQCGWDVWMVEHLERAKLAPGTDAPDQTGIPSRNEKLWDEVVTRYGLQDRATLFIDDDAPNAAAFAEFAADAEVFLNISGQFKLHHRVAHIPRRVYFDIDPGFSQLWATVWNIDMNFEAHTDFFTVGGAFSDALLPDTGHDWKTTLMPVCLDYWPETPLTSDGLSPEVDPAGAWTTVTHWYGYNAIEWDGRIYGPKRDSLLKVRDLPKTGIPLAIVTDLKPEWGEDYADFTGAGWRLIAPEAICGDLDSYRKFLVASGGEFAVAKDGYVVSKGGWFSDRSACYLALGRPVVLQDTGWSRLLPEGEGLLSWSTEEEAAEAIRKVEADPERHRKAARKIAEEYLSAAVVIPEFFRRLGV